MFCFKCGAELPDEAVFCMKCGEKLKDINSSTSSTKKSYPEILIGEYKLTKEYIKVCDSHIEIKRNFKNTIIHYESIASVNCIKDCTIFRTTVQYFNNSVLTTYHFFGYKKEQIFFDITEMLRHIAEANDYKLSQSGYNTPSLGIGFITHL